MGIETVDDYIAAYPEDIQKILFKIRSVILETAPGCKEKISYRMPAYELNGPLAYFAVHAKHIGFYPTPPPLSQFSKELSAYPTSKGAIRFPLDRPVPYDLIARIVQYSAAENAKKIKQKS